MTANVAERSPSGDTRPIDPELLSEGITMESMTAPAHAKRKNHLWVLFAIAFPAAVEVWASWVGVGSRSGFPVIRLPFGLPAFSTGFSLAVGMEAYWGYALYVWLAAAAGPRSRKFAMQSAIGAFTLSLLGQVAYHLMLAEHVAATPVIVVVFVAALPVTLLALVAFLIHLMHADHRGAEEAEDEGREAERQAVQASADAGRIAELETAVAAARAELDGVRQAASDAERRAAEAERKAEQLIRKLAAQKPNGRSAKPPNATRRTAPNAAPQARVPGDVDARTEALGLWLANPKITGKELGEAVGLGERWGQKRRAEFATAGAPKGQDAEETS